MGSYIRADNRDPWAKRTDRVICYLFWAGAAWKTSPHAFAQGRTLAEAYREAKLCMGINPTRFEMVWTAIPVTQQHGVFEIAHRS